MTISLPHPTTTCTIHYLERRSSYLATVPYRQNRPVKQKLSDAAMRLSPATWFAPAILRAHDAHEYRKDRRRLDEQYHSHRQEQLMMMKKPYRDEDGRAYRDAATMSPMTSSTPTPTPTPGRGSAIGVRSEVSLPRARALEWAGSTSVFSPGVLQDWKVLARGEWDDEDGYSVCWGPDPWALPPIEDY